MTFFQRATRKQQKRKEKKNTHTAFPLGRWDVGNPWTSAWGRKKRRTVYFGHELGVQAQEREEQKGRRRENAITEKQGEPADMATHTAALDETQVQSLRYSVSEKTGEQLTDCVRNSRNTHKKKEMRGRKRRG